MNENVKEFVLTAEIQKLLKALEDNPNALVIEAARNRFKNYVRYVQPDMVFEPYHDVYYRVLDMFADGLIKKLIIQMPPQHGKSEGSSRKLPSYILGRNPDKKVVIGSYATSFAQDFNRDVQRIIDTPAYHDLFPGTTLNGSNVVTMSNTYLRNSNVFEIVGKIGGLRVVGRGGALTGKTVDISILDDVYKDYSEGNSPIVREAAWKWYTTVVRTRLHNDSQELIVFTRWHDDDVIGRLEKAETIVDVKCWEDFADIPPGAWIRINFEAIKTGEPTELDPRPAGTSLWENRHGLLKLESNKSLDPVQFECLYQGNPGGAAGRLYQVFKTWTEKSDWGQYIRTGAYVDVADEGDDMLFAATYDVYKSQNEVFNEKTKRFEPLLFALITDLEFTEANTDVTTITVPALVNRNNVQMVYVESNSGGAQFEKTIKTKIKSMTKPFYQGGNKESRIVTASAMVNAHIVMPFGWETRFTEFYKHVTGFLRKFDANTHDDAEDGLTGIYEKEIAEGNTKPYNAASRGVKVRG
jgi:predicted phage terminase large subunit-like protein